MKTHTFFAIVVLLASANMLAEAHTLRESRKIQRTKPSEQMMPMPWVAPLFIEDQYFSSTLVLVNSTAVDGPVDITLRNTRGSVIAHKSLVVASRSNVRLEMEPLLQSARATDTTGSILVLPNKGNVAAQLALTNRKQAIASYVDEELAMPMPNSSPMLRGAADNAHGSPVLAIASTQSAIQHVTVACLASSGKRPAKTFELAANATIVTLACNDSNRTVDDIESLLLAEPSDNGDGAFGIEVTSDGVPGGFSAFGLAAHSAQHVEYFSSVSFVDPMILHSSTSIYAGVPIGSTSILPSGSYKPTVALANFGTKDAHVDVRLATTVAGAATASSLATLLVPAGNAVMADLPIYGGSPQLENSFVLSADVTPGTIVSKVVAVSDGPLREVELLGKDEKDPQNAGHHPWSLQNAADARLLLFNHTAGAQDVFVSQGYAGGRWHKKYTLQTMETLSLSIRALIEEQTPDDEGHKLPTSLSEGAVQWRATRSSITGRLFQSNATSTMARSFSCGAYDYVWDGGGASPVTFYHDGDTTTVGADKIVGTVHAPEEYESAVEYCDESGTDIGAYHGQLLYWWADNGPYYNLAPATSTASEYEVVPNAPGVEDILVSVDDGNSCGATGVGTLTVQPVITSISPARGLVGTALTVTFTGHGFSSGSTTVSVAGSGISISSISVSSSTQMSATFTMASTATSGNHGVTVTVASETSNSIDFFVQVPTSLSKVSITTIADNATGGCVPPQNWGIIVDIKYQVLDQQTPTAVAIQSSSMEPQESVDGSAYSDIGGSALYTSTLTRSDGTFDDAPIGLCATTNDYELHTQVIRILVGSSTYPVRTNSWTYSTSGAGHGTMSNGSDLYDAR